MLYLKWKMLYCAVLEFSHAALLSLLKTSTGETSACFVCEGTKCPLPWRQNAVLRKLKRPKVPYNAKITGSFTSTYLS